MSTLPRELSEPNPPRGRGHLVVSCALAALMAVILVDGTGSVDAFGVDTTTVRSDGDGYVLTVTAPRVSRPGLATPLRIHVRHTGGFTGPVDLAIERSYLQQFDFNRFYPEPSGEVPDGDFVILSFDPPDGDDFVVELDGRLEPGVQSGSAGTIRLLRGGDVVAEIEADLFVWP